MYESILFPTDGSEESLQALDHALDLAATYNARLHALYVVNLQIPYAMDDNSVVSPEPILDLLHEKANKTIAEIEARADEAGVSVTGTVLEGAVIHREILEYCAEQRIDMIVMATHGRGGLNRLVLGSVTDRIVRTADVPVLVVRIHS
jgi:nucleotide-binding universal stress UspA family protein